MSAGTIICAPRPVGGGWGRCPCCRAYKDLTVHHDKDAAQKFLVCRKCHDVLEAYIRLVAAYKESRSGGEAPG